MIPMPRPRRIEGYAIVSEDGMLANAAGIMPDSPKFEADQLFFERRLDGVDVVVHGRHSHYEIALDNNPGTPRFHGTCNALVDVAPFFDGYRFCYRPLCPPLLTLRREHIPVGLELRLQDRLPTDTPGGRYPQSCRRCYDDGCIVRSTSEAPLSLSSHQRRYQPGADFTRRLPHS